MPNPKKPWIVAGCLASLLVGGCADEQEPLIVLNAVAMNDGECVADPGAPTLPFGQLDVSYGSPYLLALVISNQLLSQTTSNSGVDDGELQLIDADVSLSSREAPELIDALEAVDPALVKFTAPLATDSIPPGSEKGVFVEVVTRAAGEALRDELASRPAGNNPEIVANVRFHARRTGNAVGSVGEVESRAYSFPINVCSACLRRCGGCDGGSCPAEVVSFDGGSCGNMQDLIWWPVGCNNPDDGPPE